MTARQRRRIFLLRKAYVRRWGRAPRDKVDLHGRSAPDGRAFVTVPYWDSCESHRELAMIERAAAFKSGR